jgi:hypothetical protein
MLLSRRPTQQGSRARCSPQQFGRCTRLAAACRCYGHRHGQGQAASEFHNGQIKLTVLKREVLMERPNGGQDLRGIYGKQAKESISKGF